jgi:acetyl esterase
VKMKCRKGAFRLVSIVMLGASDLLQAAQSDADHYHPYSSPLRASSLAGLPPALVITAEFDPLRDEGEHYAERIHAAGVPVQLIRYAGMIHGFFTMSAKIDQGKMAIQQSAAALRTVFKLPLRACQ